MSAQAAKWLALWMRKQVEAGKLARFELRHRDSVRGTDVHDITPPESHGSEWYGEAADELLAAAESDAHAISGGHQRYLVVAVRSDGNDSSRHALTVGAPGAVALPTVMGDPTMTEKVTVALMRLVEQKERLFVEHLASVVDSTQRREAQLAAENEQLRKERLESFGLIEQMLSLRDERELAREQAERRAEALSGLTSDVRNLLLPAIASRLTGQSVGDDPRVHAVKGVATTLSEEQRKKIAEFVFGPTLGLSMQQQTALGELLQSLSN